MLTVVLQVVYNLQQKKKKKKREKISAFTRQFQLVFQQPKTPTNNKCHYIKGQQQQQRYRLIVLTLQPNNNSMFSRIETTPRFQ